MRLAATLACLLLTPVAFAAETITLPSPWTSGTVLTYRQTTVDRSEGDEREHTIERSTVDVQMATTGTGERVQRWSTRDMRIEVIEASPEMRRLYEEAAKAAVPAMDVRLDPEGRYAGLANSADIAEWLRQTLTAATSEFMIETLLAEGEAEDRDEAAMLAGEIVTELVSVATSPEAVEANISWVPTLLNMWAGGTWEVGREYALERPIPVNALLLRLAGTLTYRVTLLDGGKARVDWTANAKRGNARLEETGHVRVDRASGVIEWLELERTETAMGETSTQREQLALETAATP